MEKCLVIANGAPPKGEELAYFRRKGFDAIIAADGGAEAARRMGVAPDFVVGDLDSISDEALEQLRETSEIVHIAEQESTDVEKCFRFALERGAKRAVVFGAFGDRIDHSLANVSHIVKYRHSLRATIVGGKSALSVVDGVGRFASRQGETVSLFAFNPAVRVTTLGLQYPLDKEPLAFGSRESVSNVVEAEEFRVVALGGPVVVARELAVLLAYDLFPTD
ncbi:MAG: thiamine diphosphokinase [Ignavibacteriales bacterium]|nr:thiamine diphosphokinase [Ignavibacteriales bacterium]